MGVEGAAIATVFSYLVAALFAGIYVFRKQEFLRVKFSDLSLI